MESILQDPENATIDTSMAPSLILILEEIRSTLQEQQEKIQKVNQLNQKQDIQQGKYFFPYKLIRYHFNLYIFFRLAASNYTIKYYNE